MIAENQQWHCPVCHEHLINGEQLQIHHIIPIHANGSDNIDNLILLHRACHQQLHQLDSVPDLLEA